MKRTIIYVFGPKRLAHQYNEGNNASKPHDVCDVTNWLKIGLTTTEDDTLDKWDAAEKRISQESRTGLNEPCVILDVFEYPYIEGKPDDVVRRLMTDDVYNFANSRANNGLIVNKYEIKAGQEFVYGASRSHVLAAIAKFERNLILRKCPKLEPKDEELNEFVNLIKMIQSNMDDVSDEQEDTSSSSSPQVSTEVDAFYWKLIDAMPGNIKEKCNHTNGKNYMTIRTRRNDCKWYYLTFSVKRNSTTIQLETYGGAENRDKVNNYIEENNILSTIPELKNARQGKSDNKFSWDLTGQYDGNEESVIKWFVKNTIRMFEAFEPDYASNIQTNQSTPDVITVICKAPYTSFGPQTPELCFKYDYASGNYTYDYGNSKLREETINRILSFLKDKNNISRFFSLPDIQDGFHDNQEFLTIEYGGRTKNISQNCLSRKFEHPFFQSQYTIEGLNM